MYPDAFALADQVVLCQPLHKEGDKLTADQIMDAAVVCRSIEAKGKAARFIAGVPDIVDFVASTAQPGDVILAMSGRDFQGLHGQLLARLAERAATGA